MRTLRLAPIALAVLPFLGGCATSGSLTGKDGCQVYGGTRLDATIISESLAGDSELAKTESIERPVLLWAACCGLVDLPFSVVADTVLLPITIPIANAKSRHQSEIANSSN